MWRYTRIFLALLCFSGFLLLFMDVSGTLPPSLAFLAKIQLMPAILSGSVGVVLALLGLTLLLGRVYCSTLCPLGVLQDILARLPRMAHGKQKSRRRYHYRPGNTLLRSAFFVVFVAALLAGIPLIFGLLEPYSAFGRMATELLLPVVTLGNNAIAFAAQKMNSVAVAPSPVVQQGLSALLGAVLTLGIVGWLSVKGGRTWCNTLCPVGTGLGLLARYSLLRPRIRAEKCVDCGLCVASCKASCINSTTGSIDASRCVACFNCLDKCRHGALSLRPLPALTKKVRHTEKTPAFVHPDLSRRALLLGITASVAAVPAHAASAIVTSKGRDDEAHIPALTRKERPARSVPVTPPGSVSFRHYASRCTGCQLCVSACPHQVLRTQDKGKGMLQPTMSFEHGFCRVNCVVCSTVCPTGAILPLTVAEKSATQVGRVVVRPDMCIVNTDAVHCTACVRSCPPAAITLVGEGELKLPAVDNERCTGCGACEYVCPARPFAAIRVEGNLEHRRI